MILDWNLSVSKNREQSGFPASVDSDQSISVSYRQLELSILEYFLFRLSS